MKHNQHTKTNNFFIKQTKSDWLKSLGERRIKNKFNNIFFDPIYFQNNRKNITHNKGGEWAITHKIKIKNSLTANSEALKILNLGVNSITFINPDNSDLNTLLKNIQIDIIRINFEKVFDVDKFITMFHKFCVKNEINSNNLKGFINCKSLTKDKYYKYKKILPNFQFLKIKTTSFKKKSIQKYIDFKNILFVHNINKNMIEEISFLRSFRINIEQSKNISPFIEAIINTRNSNYHKLIETCSKSITAILGGCDSIIVNSKIRDTLKIQQQLILKYESNLNKVSDSLHGSYLIEEMTNSLLDSKKNNFKLPFENNYWAGPEEIKLKSKYDQNDTEGLTHIKYGVGKPPYLRGPYLTMYCDKKWTIRQYAGFSTAEESNKFYKKNLKAGQSGLSVAFDLPTHRGYDSDHPRVFGDVGKAGVAIDSVEDMEILFNGIDLNNISVSMTMNGAILPIMAFFIVVAKKNGVKLENLRGTIQNDILKEFMVRNTYIYPPNPSMRIVSDIFKYTSKNMPKFNSISVSGYHMLEAGASADLEIAYTLADGLEYVRTGLKAGLDIDDFAPRLSFFWGVGMNFFTEIAKIRAARYLWTELIQEFNPKNPKSLMLRSHCQTSGWSLIAQEPENNITRTTIEAIGAVFAGTQSLHTNAMDEAISLPTNSSAKIARDTQLYLQKETGICNFIDPLGGSHYLETLTDSLIKNARSYINEIEKVGGMSKAIDLGIPKLKIEKSAIQRQSSIDLNKSLIIGLNCFKTKNNKKIKILDINNELVQKKQIKKITNLKKKRNVNKVTKLLDKLTSCCRNNNENLLSIAIEAAELGATLGEISFACEKVFGRYQAKTIMNTGVYEKKHINNKQFMSARKLSDKFELNNGRRPRILAAKLGQDGHDRGIKIIATCFSDIGFDVDIAPLFGTPEEVAKQAVENDVHIVGISSLAGGHKTLIPKLINSINAYGENKIMIVVGGIIPQKDYNFLYKSGVSQIFGPGTIVSQAALEVLKKLTDGIN